MYLVRREAQEETQLLKIRKLMTISTLIINRRNRHKDVSMVFVF